MLTTRSLTRVLVKNALANTSLEPGPSGKSSASSARVLAITPTRHREFDMVYLLRCMIICMVYDE